MSEEIKKKIALTGILSVACLSVKAQNVVADNQTMLISVGVLFLACLICYIIAIVKSRRGQMVLTANGWDKVLLLTTPVCLFIAWFWGFDNALNDIQLVLLIIAGAGFVGTTIFSITHNQENVTNILLSIVAKIFIVWLTLFLLILVVVVLIISVLISITNKKDEDEYILVKYDRVLDAYVGYKVNIRH